MESRSTNLGIEPVIWARLIQAQGREISPEVARFLLSVEFGESDRQRMEYLAEHSEAGTLTPDEEAEFDGYLHIGNLLAVMQSKARVVLEKKALTLPRS